MMQPIDNWLHAHWEMLILGAGVFWAFVVFSWKSLTGMFVTKTHLEICREDVRKIDDELERQVQTGFQKLSDELYAVSAENSRQHNEIFKMIAKLHIGDKDA